MYMYMTCMYVCTCTIVPGTCMYIIKYTTRMFVKSAFKQTLPDEWKKKAGYSTNKNK